jgi:hypothetical protein
MELSANRAFHTVITRENQEYGIVFVLPMK